MLIEGRDIVVTIEGRPILEGESVLCAPGKMTALTGPSGSGKTTLLHALGLLVPVAGGTVVAGGVDVTRHSAGRRRRFWRDHAAFVLQDYGVIDDESVAFNVTMSSQTPRRRDANARLTSSLHATGLAARRDEPASHLSGGEKQRLSLARAIYREASVLFVDEPTASLDAANRHAVVELFADFARGGATVIVASHDDEMIEACDVRHEMMTREVVPMSQAVKEEG
ncbi:MAG: hypothetical protein RI885_1214 [Actinomycetota bacterium]|jgi:putative ABC transport system ATP-binding protein